MIFGIFIFLCAILGGLHIFGNSNPPDFLVFICILIFSAVYLSHLSSSGRIKKVVQALACGYCLRLILVIVDIYLRGTIHLPNSGADSEMFYYGAIRYLEDGGFARGFFVKVMAFVFSIFGVSRLWGQFLIMLCSIVGLHFAEKTLRELHISEAVCAKVLLILGLLPNAAILSSIFVRESLIYMMVSISLFCFVRWFVSNQEKFFFLALLASLGAMRFHSGTVAVPLAYIVIRFLYNNKLQKFAFSAKNVIFALLFLGLGALFAFHFQDEYLAKMSGVESLEEIANTNDMGGSSYAKYVGNSASPLGMILYTPLRIIFFLFSPLPIFWRGIADIIAFCFSSMFYLWAVVSSWKYLLANKRSSIQRTLVIALLVVAGCTVFVFGWGVSNAGTACRHREKVSVLYGVLLALTMKEKKRPVLVSA